MLIGLYRNKEEKEVVKAVLEKHIGIKIDLAAMYGLENDSDFQRVMALLEEKEKEGHAKVSNFISTLRHITLRTLRQKLI